MESWLDRRSDAIREAENRVFGVVRTSWRTQPSLLATLWSKWLKLERIKMIGASTKIKMFVWDMDPVYDDITKSLYFLSMDVGGKMDFIEKIRDYLTKKINLSTRQSFVNNEKGALLVYSMEVPNYHLRPANTTSNLAGSSTSLKKMPQYFRSHTFPS